ncbi:hypothetical protein AA0119_g2387 [Alternaria tenuissima]|uniref:Uncharacterized protein n=1 Tax=Alternaria tenuissima TaxID=119927 RepID=A0ABY0GJE6_9PLEO|nr:hypothetical protein AA0119_g2387 [Alternaria tenuissima]RYO18855.1 hypothetical protein AA0121_g4575 [Alternaria tenuissima]
MLHDAGASWTGQQWQPWNWMSFARFARLATQASGTGGCTKQAACPSSSYGQPD